MGICIARIQEKESNKSFSPLLNISLSRLQEFYGSFQSVCDNFCIDLTEFEQIFGANESSFIIWDTDDNGLIDSLELFAGLAIFSQSEFHEKISFLFYLFDFNDEGELELNDIQFMLDCCMSSIFKIYQIEEGSDHEILSSFVLDNFSENIKIDYNKLMRWCSKNKEINAFFRVIHKELPQVRRSIQNPKIIIQPSTKELSCFDILETSKMLTDGEKDDFFQKSSDRSGIAPINKNIVLTGKEFDTNHYQAKIEWMTKLRATVSPNLKEDSILSINGKISWIYGMRCPDMVNSFCYHNDKKGKGTSEKLIYACSRLVVIFLHKLNEQRHYTNHTSEVRSLAASNGNFIASGEGNTVNPSIHIWDIHTLKTLCEFKGQHKTDVYLLKFLKNDRHLASCSLRDNTPIYIFDRVKKNIVFSCRIQGVARGIVPIALVDFKKKENTVLGAKPSIHKNFIMFTKYNLLYFKQSNLHSIINLQDTKKYREVSDITSCLSYVLINEDINVTLEKDETFTEHRTKNKLFALTGHVDGKVILWVNMIPKKKLFDFEVEIIDMCIILPYIGIATNDFKVHILNIQLGSIIKTIDFNKHTFRYHSLSLKNIVPTEGDIIINTYRGDFFKIELIPLDPEKPALKGIIDDSSFGDEEESKTVKVKVQKVKLRTKERKLVQLTVFKGECTALSMIEKDDERLMFMCCEDYISYGFSSENNDMIDYWEYPEERLTAIEAAIVDDDHIILVYGTDGGQILFRENWALKESVFEVNAPVTQIKFSHDLSYLMILTEEGSVYNLEQVSGRFENLKGPYNLINGFVPRSVNFNEELEDVILTGEDNQILRVGVSNFKVRDEIEGDDYINMRRGEFRFNYILDEESEPYRDYIILGNDLQFSLSSDNYGNLIIYKNQAALEENCGIYCLGHSSQIQEMKISNQKEFLITAGKFDQSLIEWFLETEENDDIHRAVLRGQFFEIEKELEESKIVAREIEFCRGNDRNMHTCQDSLTEFRANVSKDMNILAYDEDLMFEEDQYVQKRVPEISLKLRHVYGIECFNTRNTIFYLHYYSISDQRKIEKEANIEKERKKKMEEVPLHPNYIKEMLFSKFSALPYDKKHHNCKRRYCYFTSRLAIISKNQGQNVKQNFYQGHRAKISCMAIHPSKLIVASGEACKHPYIHVWSAINYSMIVEIDTQHSEGVLNLCFSYDGFYLISIGLDKNFSIQVTNWREKNIVAVAYTSSAPLLHLAVNPYDRSEFSVCGLKKVQTWKVEGRSLVLKENIDIPKTINNGANYLVCLSYIYYLLGDEVITDLVLGNSFGDIGLVTCKKYIIMKQGAHDGMINCLKITDILSDKLAVVTAGEDELIKFWDTSFKLIKTYNIRKHLAATILQSEGKIKQNFSAQSIDFFACQPPPNLVINKKKTTGFEKTTPEMLVCTRNGDILEISLTYKFDGAKPTEEDEITENVETNENKGEEEANLIDFDQRVLVSYLVTQSDKKKSGRYGATRMETVLEESNNLKKKQEYLNFQFRKIYFTVKPSNNMLVTVSTNGKLCIWDLKSHREDLTTDLEGLPSFITFSPDRKLLAVGMRNGKVNIYLDVDSNDFELIQSIENEKEDDTNAVRILFSQTGQHLAVSYLCFEQIDDIYSKKGGYVRIFEKIVQSVKETKKRKNSQKSETKILFGKIGEIWNPHADKKGVKVKLGAYFMSFDSTEDHLIINFQIIDEYLNRDLEDKESAMIVWNIKSQKIETNKDIWKSLKFQKFEFPNRLNCRRKTLKRNENESVFKDNKLTISNIGDFGEYLIMGGTDGDLSIIKRNFLYLDEDKAVESIKAENYCLAKNYIAHQAPVDLIKKAGNLLFTSSIYNENIFEWEIIQGKKDWELDLKDYKIDIPDIMIRDFQSKEEYFKVVEEMLPLRNEIVELNQNIDLGSDPELSLELHKVIGRKALNRRKNMFYTQDNHLVFSAASLIILTNIPPEGIKLTDKNRNIFFHEQFLEPDCKYDYSISPEISTLTICKERKYLCVGTIQSKAKLILWELTTMTYLKSLILDDCCVVLNISFSYNRKRIACVALTKSYTQRVYILDGKELKILGATELKFSTPIKIKDVEFLPKTDSGFITIGLQHMSRWQLQGGNLTFQELPIENPREIMQRAGVLQVVQEREHRKNKNDEYVPIFDDEGNEIFPLNVTFLTVIFLYDKLIITAGDDGYLYIWKDFKIVKKKNAHLNSTILCMSGSSYHPRALDGTVNLWEMSNPDSGNSLIIEKLYEYPLPKNPGPILKQTFCHVQSLQFRFNTIIAGTRSGDIFFLSLPAASEIKSTATDSKNLIQKVYSCTNHMIPREVDFDANNERIICITESGLFTIWDFESLKIRVSKNFEKSATRMVVFKSVLWVAITFEKRLIILDIKDDKNVHEIESFTLEFELVTSDLKVNIDENMIAIAMAPNYEVCTTIEIYKIIHEEKKFELYHSMGNISSSIEFMDFSSDNVYLMYVDNIKKRCFINLKNKTNDESEILNLKHNVEWISDGLKISEKIRGIAPCYTEDNEVTCLVRVGHRSMIAADQIGTLRIFPYPCEFSGYYKMYTHHLSFIVTCHVSKNGRYLVSCSSIDRCIIVWKIKEEKGSKSEPLESMIKVNESMEEF